MPKLQMRRIRLAEAGAAGRLAELRDQLSAQGNVVSPRGRALTERVFGEALPPARVVERICEDVRQKGLAAVLEYTRQLDQAELTAETIRVGAEELVRAHRAAEPAFLGSVRRLRQNIQAFQSGLVHSDAVLRKAETHELRLRYRPVRRVGVMVPGGAAAYPSTLLMTVVPAHAAGVPEVAVVMPPTATGAFNPDLLAVCHELGVREVYRVGGAQAVAALAYGVEGLPAVDMIVGPGNIFVALAKRHVYGRVAIDCIAGPSEVVVLADDSANPDHLAHDLIAQAEHSPGASILMTWHEPLLDAVEEGLNEALPRLARGALAQESLESYGALVLARNEKEAVERTNELAPEHLHIMARNEDALAEQVLNVGAVFVGAYSPVAVGDYAAGPSHVLPTGGTARFASGLSAVDFQRRSSVIRLTRKGLEGLAGDVVRMAEKEGLTGHASSVRVRFDPS